MQQQQKIQQQEQLQQQQQQLSAQTSDKPLENIYEHLPGGSQVRLAAQNEGTFTRGSPQRNTFSEVIRAKNRQVKIIDGKPVVGQDGMTHGQSNTKRGYESETPETPVILRRKQDEDGAQASRRIGGLLTREEILQKIKEFCRKSLNKTPTNQTNPPLQAIYEKQAATNLSPVSYVSVETHQKPASRMYVAPQEPQRMHSLQTTAAGGLVGAGHFVPIVQEIVTDPNTNSPIYAHVVKRGSLQSNQSELYEIPTQRTLVAAQPTQYLIRREPELKPVYIRQGTLQKPESTFSPVPPTQFILVDGEKLQLAQIITAYPQNDLYAQPQYIRPHQLQTLTPSTAYGYITVREPLIQPQTITQQLQHQQIIRPRLHDGRSTPLILDRSSSQQVSQIYWTPQHQRLQYNKQQAELLTDQISPRYALKQSYVMSSPQQQQQQQQQNRATPTIMMLQPTPPQPQPQHSPMQIQQSNSIPMQQRTRQYTPIVRDTNTPNRQQQLQQLQLLQNKPQQPQIQELSSNNTVRRQSPAFDWESGSEAGEVQRIMEKQQQNDLKYIQLSDLQKPQQLQQNG